MCICIFMYKPRFSLADQTILVTPRAPPSQQPNTAQSPALCTLTPLY